MISESEFAVNFLQEFVDCCDYFFNLFIFFKKKEVIREVKRKELLQAYRCCDCVFKTFPMNVKSMEGGSKFG